MNKKKETVRVWFYLKKNEPDVNGNCPVMGRITLGKSMAQFSLKFTCPLELWDTRNSKATGKSSFALELNRKLEQARLAIFNRYSRLLEIKADPALITALEIKEAYQGIARVQPSLVKFFARHNQMFQKQVGVNRENSTYLQYENSLKHLLNFLNKKCRLTDIPFSRLDLSFILSYDFYLRIELKLKANTILGITRHLRRMIKLAIDDQILCSDPFIGYKPEKPKPEQKYLTKAELDTIINTPLDHPSRYLTRDMFLFSCFTGLAYRDIFNLTAKNLVKDEEGTLWIKTTRQKTGTPCDIPLLEIPQKILEKYKGINKEGKLLPMLSCGKLNIHLKTIGKLCGINKRLIFHMGRHTYASEICLSQGVPIESVSRMLGHKDLRSTQIYAKITEDKIGEDIDTLQSRLAKKYKDRPIV